MQVQENRYIKWAGVAGLRARAGIKHMTSHELDNIMRFLNREKSDEISNSINLNKIT